jgi:hypothetical protein
VLKQKEVDEIEKVGESEGQEFEKCKSSKGLRAMNNPANDGLKI